jgi:hypothetical protein
MLPFKDDCSTQELVRKETKTPSSKIANQKLSPTPTTFQKLEFEIFAIPL